MTFRLLALTWRAGGAVFRHVDGRSLRTVKVPMFQNVSPAAEMDGRRSHNRRGRYFPARSLP